MDIPLKELYADSIEFSYTYKHSLLSGVFIDCKVGDITALLGRNGCGKSTLMKILFGTLKPKEAYIRLNGKRIACAYESKDICYLPQHHFLPTHKTVCQMIDFMVEDSKLNSDTKQNELVAKLLSNKIADLSSGEQRYLELLLLIQQPATFYLLDEPFSGVAPYMKEQIQQLIISQLAYKGFIISDHHYVSVIDISTQILLLQNGGCRYIQDKKDLELFYVPEGTFDQ